MGSIVIAAYRPRPGKEERLRELVAGHVAILREEGLATDRPVVVLRAPSDGTLLEVFEWRSQEAVEAAHSNPRVRELWTAFEEASEYVPLAALAEAKEPFGHFEPLDEVGR